MKSLWAGIKLGFRALIGDPGAYLTDPVKATTDIYRADMVEAGYTTEVIETRLDEYRQTGGIIGDLGEAYGSAVSGVGSAIRSVGKILNFSGKNLGLILVIAVALIAAWYFLLARKVTQ